MTAEAGFIDVIMGVGILLAAAIMMGELFSRIHLPVVLGQLIEDTGVKSEEMYKTFNMGIGFCVIAPKNNVAKIRSIFKKHKFATYEIGKITSKKGVFINSKKIA